MRIRQGTSTLLAAVLAVGTLAPATPAHAYHREKAQIASEIKATKAKLSAAKGNEERMREIVVEIDTKLRLQQSRLNEARSKVAQIELKIATTEARLIDLAERERDRHDTVNERAAALYMLGPLNSLTAVASAPSVDAFVSRAQAVNFIASFDQRMLEDLASIQYETKLGRITLREARQQATEIRSRVARRYTEVATWRRAKADALNRIRGSVNRYHSMIRALEAEQQRIQNIISGRGSFGGSVYTGPTSSLGFAWPVRGGINSPYGPRWGGFHTGIDIQCSTGQSVGASRSGTVIASQWMGGYGNTIIIDHGDGFSTLYAHNSRLVAGRGAKVSRGQVVSLCGSTGNSTGAHLHFEIRYNGSHRNPRPYLP